MIVGFAFKLALVPFQMWAPDVYQGAPTSVTGFMSVGAKVAGFSALGRVVLVALGDLQGAWVWVLAVLAALTMTVGNLAALRQTNLKRMLAYSSIAHAGYILVGVAAGNELGSSGLLFYLFAYAFMNVAAFAIIIAVGRFKDVPEGGETLEAFSGLAARKPGLAIAMTLTLLSLAGFPPLAGFLAKLTVFGAAVQADLTWLAIVGVINSVISATYYLRVVAAMVLRGPERATSPTGQTESETESPICPALQAGVGLASLAIVVLGVWPAPIMNLARLTATSLGLTAFGG
jgi:NADH-quinone oxidoreductase subunit N